MNREESKVDIYVFYTDKKRNQFKMVERQRFESQSGWKNVEFTLITSTLAPFSDEHRLAKNANAKKIRLQKWYAIRPEKNGRNPKPKLEAEAEASWLEC